MGIRITTPPASIWLSRVFGEETLRRVGEYICGALAAVRSCKSPCSERAGAGIAGFAPKEPSERDSGAKSSEVIPDPSPRRRRPARTMIED